MRLNQLPKHAEIQTDLQDEVEVRNRYIGLDDDDNDDFEDGLKRRVVLQKFTDVLEVLAAYIIRTISNLL
jgi:hypothetical protein